MSPAGATPVASRVLVVGSDADVTTALHLHLDRAGHAMYCVPGPADLETFLRVVAPHVVVLMLPASPDAAWGGALTAAAGAARVGVRVVMIGPPREIVEPLAAVEAQRARLEAEERQGQVVELRARLEVREAAHGASVDGLLLEKAREEKDLIEVVASTEKRLHEQAALHRAALAREAALARQLGEATERVAGLEEEGAARDALLRQARREQERRSAEHSQERQAAMVQESALQAALDRARSDTEELSAMLARATGERDQALVRAAALVAELAGRDAVRLHQPGMRTAPERRRDLQGTGAP